MIRTEWLREDQVFAVHVHHLAHVQPTDKDKAGFSARGINHALIERDALELYRGLKLFIRRHQQRIS